jgi:hypothetical protein
MAGIFFAGKGNVAVQGARLTRGLVWDSPDEQGKGIKHDG